MGSPAHMMDGAGSLLAVNLLTDKWQTVLPPTMAHVGVALVALCCGAVIGVEREKNEKPAGLRTLILVCLGAAAFTMAGNAFPGEDGRVAAQIVTGIGFLGAGIILHPRGTISGATTAATIWATASVGMLAGEGYAGGAIGMTVLIRFVLSAVALYEERLFGRQDPVLVMLDYEPDGGRTRVRLEGVLVDYRIPTTTTEWGRGEEGLDRLILKLRLPRHHLGQLLNDLVELDEVKRVREETVGS